MIDARYQRLGYGRSALSLLVESLRVQGIKQLLTSCVPGVEGPYGFYLSFGFEDTGGVSATGERFMTLRL
jgi:diamine N-acetyltransferase